jgi:predicted DNA-binding protein
MATKAMSLRLPEDKATELEAVARTDEVPVSEAVREAIDRHIAARRADKDFQKRLKRRLAEDRAVLERLAEND